MKKLLGLVLFLFSLVCVLDVAWGDVEVENRRGDKCKQKCSGKYMGLKSTGCFTNKVTEEMTCTYRGRLTDSCCNCPTDDETGEEFDSKVCRTDDNRCRVSCNYILSP